MFHNTILVKVSVEILQYNEIVNPKNENTFI